MRLSCGAKNYSLPVLGKRNGTWKLRHPNGEISELDERENPYHQTLNGKFALSDKMRSMASKNRGLPRPQPHTKFYETIESVICIYPELLPGSEVPNDRKVSTKGYSELLEFVLTHERNPGWSNDHWRAFAMNLSLTHTAGGDDMNPALVHASRSVRNYQRRFVDAYGKDLPALVSTRIESNGKEVTTTSLLTFLFSGRHGLLIGPSGAGKSHHAKHMMLEAVRHDWLPVLLRAQQFDGKLASLLDRSVAHLHPSTFKALHAATVKCAVPIVFVVDGVNECPENLKADLLQTLQAYVLRRPIPILITAQQQLCLAEQLGAEVFELKDLGPKEKEAVFKEYYQEQLDADRVKLLTEAFRTPYEIRLAAEGLAHSPATTITRLELFDTFVSRRLIGVSSPMVARRMLCALARAMSEQFVNSLATLEAVSILDRVLIDEGAGAILIDELTGTGLLDVTQRFWVFRHELLGQFFAAIELQRRSDESGLAAELSRPRNRDLAEFVISLASEPSLILECFRALKDPGLISIATSGDLGRPAKEAAQSQILAMFHTILDDLNNLRMELKFPDAESGEVWPLLRITNGGQWSDYQMAILRAIGISLAKGMYITEFVALIERLETLPHQVFTDESNVGKAAKAPLQELLFQAFYRDQFMQPQAHFATATIIASARETAWRYEHLRAPQAIIELLESVCEQRTGTLFLLANLLRQYRQDERVHASLPLLFNACWDSGLYHLRLDAIYMVQGFSHSLSVQHREIIKEKLPFLLSDNLFLNTVVAEAMSAYGILEPIADVDSVGKILKEILSRPDDPEARQAAHGAISNIFEDVLEGVYSEAIHELSREDQIRLYTMAAYGTPNYSWFGDFILQELLDFNDPNTLPVFEHWAASIDADSSSIQTVVRSYQLAVMGCARFSTAPPQLAITDSNDWLAWQQYGEIIFWMNKAGCDEAELRTRCQRAWESLTTDLISEAVDPLMQFEHSDRAVSLNGGLARRLFLLFPEPIRVILQHGLVHLDKLSTIFAKVEPFNKDRRPEFVISSLGWVGDIETVKLLEPLVDSPTLGRSAVQSIRQIKNSR